MVWFTETHLDPSWEISLMMNALRLIGSLFYSFIISTLCLFSAPEGCCSHNLIIFPIFTQFQISLNHKNHFTKYLLFCFSSSNCLFVLFFLFVRFCSPFAPFAPFVYSSLSCFFVILFFLLECQFSNLSFCLFLLLFPFFSSD